ncbi:MAG: CRISPR-associated endonuclease Cas1 [Isosphaeraceae bacterium]
MVKLRGRAGTPGATSIIRRTVEISREPAHLCLRHNQLVLKRGDEVAGSIPCEDVGMVVVDHPQATYTHALLARLTDVGAVVVVCGPTHLPAGLLLPLADHTEVVWRLEDQISASVPTRKRLWQQIVRAKIIAQAENLAPDSPTRGRLLAMARDVKSGDAEAHESQAARIYWQAWLIEGAEADPPSLREGGPGAAESPPDQPRPSIDELHPFHRDADGDGLNALLNYGYAIVRAAVARALVSAGLHPALGVQHRNRGNAFCLADDLMEPLRPLVDRRARWLWWSGERDLAQPVKAELLKVLTDEVSAGTDRGPLQVALHRYTASFVRCLRKEDDRLLIPRVTPGTQVSNGADPPCASAATDPCGS